MILHGPSGQIKSGYAVAAELGRWKLGTARSRSGEIHTVLAVLGHTDRYRIQHGQRFAVYLDLPSGERIMWDDVRISVRGENVIITATGDEVLLDG